jgi:hypothetical protein
VAKHDDLQALAAALRPSAARSKYDPMTHLAAAARPPGPLRSGAAKYDMAADVLAGLRRQQL